MEEIKVNWGRQRPDGSSAGTGIVLLSRIFDPCRKKRTSLTWFKKFMTKVVLLDYEHREEHLLAIREYLQGNIRIYASVGGGKWLKKFLAYIDQLEEGKKMEEKEIICSGFQRVCAEVEGKKMLEAEIYEVFRSVCEAESEFIGKLCAGQYSENMLRMLLAETINVISGTHPIANTPLTFYTILKNGVDIFITALALMELKRQEEK